MTNQRTGVTPSRVIALEALLDVQQSGSYSGLALSKRLKDSNLSPVDRGFVTELFYGVLERRLQLEYILSKFMERPMQDDVVRLIMQMGVYQIMFMDRVPDFAACNQQVELTKRFQRGSLIGIVNAVLRNVSRGKESIEYPSAPVERISVLYSCPQWLTLRLLSWFDEPFVEGLLGYSGKDRAVVVRPNMLRLDDAAFEKQMESFSVEFEKSDVPHLYKVKNLRPGHPLIAEGNCSVMGESSAMAVMALGLKPGMQVLDACAAPGGKTCLIAETMGQSGRVHAFDLHEHRVKLVSAYAKRLGIDTIRPRQRDASELIDDMVQTMDAVLVDAPCSGIGVMHEKPDIKYSLNEETLEALPKTQSAILDTCSQYVKWGGSLVYSTCTLAPDENEQIIIAFLESHPEFALDEGLKNLLPAKFGEKAAGGMVTFYPHVDGVDGFFIARLVKRR